MGSQQPQASGGRRVKLVSVRRVSDEPAYLYELIQTIGSGPDLDSILRGVVPLVTEATSCHACFVYLFRDDSLELRAASSPYEHLEGEVRIPLGEGLTGWVAKTRRSAFIKEGALQDPRVRRAYFSELGDEVYQSLVSVPILARSGDVIGAITLHAEAPHEFARADLDFLEHTASLIAGAVENARQYEDATARVALLTNLSRLSQQIASAATSQEVLEAVTRGIVDLLDAERCEIHLLGPDEQLRLASALPERPPGAPVDVRALWLKSLEEDTRRDRPAEVRALASALWGDEPGTRVAAPLIAGDERLGILTALLRTAAPDADSILSAIAAHTSVALKQHQVIEWLREKNLVKDFFQTLARVDAPAQDVFELARRLGCNVDAPHLILHVVPCRPQAPPTRGRKSSAAAAEARDWNEVGTLVEARLAARFPGLLFDHLEGSIRALVPLRTETQEQALDALGSMSWSDPQSALSVGVSNACRGVGSYSRGFEEASSAAEVGALIRGGPGITTYEDLGPYRYVLSSGEGARDTFQQRLETLVEYDRRRGTHLLDTLEGYIDHRGNVVGTSRGLFIHSNTLRQRLERIQRVTGIDLERDDWLSLAVATKIVKLRRMRRAAGEEGGHDG